MLVKLYETQRYLPSFVSVLFIVLKNHTFVNKYINKYNSIETSTCVQFC